MRVRALLLAAALSALAGCTVPSNGLTGISVDAGRHLLVVLAWCGSTQPDVVTIYHEDERGEITDGVYVAPRLTGQRASVRLDDPGSSGWELEGAPNLREETLYVAYGGTEDNKFSTASVRFRLDDVDRLRPDVVLVQDANEVDQVVSRSDFERQARDSQEVECG